MRISLTVISKGKDPLKISLAKLDNKGFNHYEITSSQAEDARRVLSQEEIGCLTTMIGQMTVPVLSPFIHHQGDTYLLKIENVLNSVNFVWCAVPPRGWEQIQALVDFIVKIAP